MEFTFSITVYPLTPEKAAELRERLQAVLLAEIEAQGLFMGPVEVVIVEGAADEQKN